MTFETGKFTQPFEDDSHARHYLAAIIGLSEDPVIITNLEGAVTGWSPAAVRIFGYSAEEMIGQPILRIIPREFYGEEEEIFHRVISGERVPRYDSVRLTKGGETIHVSIGISSVRDDFGQATGTAILTRNASDRKGDETQSRLAAIVDCADDAIIGKDMNSVITSWNEAARRIFGYTAQEMVGQSILKLIPHDLRHEEDEILRKLRAGERIDHYETKRLRADGSVFDVSATISPIRDETGRVIGASKILRDISDRKRMERLLVQSEKFAATGRMAAAIAHEINNPLESLMNLIYLARQTMPAGGEAQGYLLTAENELERVSHIARQTLGYYRDNSAPMETHFRELVENVLTVYSTRFLASGITVEKSFNDLQKIVVSRGEMIQVLSNIVANAIDAMRHGGKLSIATRKIIGSNGDGIQVVIQDDGVGISRQNLQRIFEPFFTTKGDLGTGIGLWVAKQLVEKRGGQIAIASSAEAGHSGTTLTIFLPFAPPAGGLELDTSV